MGKIHSVSFKKSEKDIYKHAMEKESFSEYIKLLIKEDLEKRNNIFTEEEIQEIKRIIKAEMIGRDNISE